LQYSEPMVARDASGNRIVLDGGNADVDAAVRLMVEIVPPGVAAVKESRIANLFSVIDSRVTFSLRINTQDPSGTVFIANDAPLIFTDGANIVSKRTNSSGPVVFPLNLIANNALSTVDNIFPVVTSIISPNSTIKYPWGTGDVIDIFITMSLPVVIRNEPTLLLFQGTGSKYATFVTPTTPSSSLVGGGVGGGGVSPPPPPLPAAFVTVLHFRYTVVDGDYAIPLDYNSPFALNGDLRRYSSNGAILPANLTLPVPFSPGSLSFCCNVQIDTTKPFILSIIPLKRAGIYGENEKIVIVARFNKPVVVAGKPRLLLKTSANSIGVAEYIPSFSSNDLLFDFQDSDVLFQYSVRLGDNVLSLHHTDENAFVVPHNASVLHKTLNSSTAADVLLRKPTDTSPINNEVTRQWKFRFPQKVEVLLRDLYHTRADSLTVEVEHLGHKTQLLSGGWKSTKGMALGHSYPSTHLGNNATVKEKDTGIGYSYLFSDTLVPNIARQGAVQQSSTIQDARRAIDGNMNPLINQLVNLQHNHLVNHLTIHHVSHL